MPVLKGLNVINLSINLPGPVLAYQLTQRGANVTKIEPPIKDPLAVYFYPYYKKLTEKQHLLSLNLKTSSGKKELYEHLAHADLLITSSRVESLNKLGLSQKQLKSNFPHLSHLAIIGYKKPRDHVAGHDLNFVAESGLLADLKMPSTCWADLAGAQQGVIEVLTMMMLAKQEKKAQYRELVLSQALDLFADPLRFGLTGEGQMLGGGLPNYNIYPTKSGHIALGALESHFFKNLINKLKLKNKNPDFNELKDLFMKRSAEDWQKWGEKNDVPITKIVNLKEKNKGARNGTKR